MNGPEGKEPGTAPETFMLPGRPYAGDESIWLPDREQAKQKMKHLFPKAEGNADT